MADKVADKDITIENAMGQTVVVVPEGQPVPDDLDEVKDRMHPGPISQASDEQIDEARGLKSKKK
jgi:hypothetical protein